MGSPRAQRQRAIVDILRENSPLSHEEVSARLTAAGHQVSRATVSQDLEQIGAVKVRRGGQFSYAFAEEVRGGAAPRLAAVLRDWVRSAESAANLVVLRTPPGSAHLVGVALDDSELPEIVGTICGDDTIFIACRSPGEADTLSVKLRSELQ